MLAWLSVSKRGADLRIAQLMPLPLTVSCFSKIQTGFTFLELAHPGSPGKRAVKQMCVCVREEVCLKKLKAVAVLTELCSNHYNILLNEQTDRRLKTPK